MNVAGLGAGHGQHGVITAGAEAAETAGVGRGVEYVELGGGAGEGEHLDHVLQHHHYPVSAQSDGQYFRTKLQLDDNFLLQVVPDTDFVRRRSWSVPPSDNGYVVTPVMSSSHHGSPLLCVDKPKQHLRESDPATFTVSLSAPVLSLLAADWVTVVDPKASLCPNTETALVLVEAGVKQPIVIQLLLAQIHPL